MAELVQKTYATSLFEVALAENTLDEIYSQLKAVVEIVSQNPQFEQIMCSAAVTKQEKLSIIKNTFENNTCGCLYNFLRVLSDNSRFSSLKAITGEFEAMYNSHNNILAVTVTTAAPLSETLEKKLTQKLCSVTGKQIRLTKLIDEQIIGGIILKYNNTEINSTLKAKLAEIKQQLINIIA